MLKHIYKGTAVILVCFMLASTFFPVPATAAVFADINGHWAEKDILKSASANIINGYSGKFWPKGNVTRAQFTIMIVNALGLETEAAALKGMPTGYADLRPSHYAAGHILVAREKGLISGYPDGTFGPERQIRRDEITSILIRALSISNVKFDENLLEKFTDAEDIPQWARASASQAVVLKLLSGFPDGTFRPARPASRGETAVLINKLLRELNREYTFQGQVSGLNEDRSELNLKIGGQEDIFYYTADTSFYYLNGKIRPTDLKAGDTVAIILDNMGRLNYIEKLDIKAETNATSESKGLTLSSQAKTFKSPVAAENKNGLRQEQVLIATKPGLAATARDEIRALGGQVSLYYPEIDFLSASIDPIGLSELAKSGVVDSINIDKAKKTLPLATAEKSSSTGKDPEKSLAVTKGAISADVFSELKEVNGKGRTIAIIDTGIDPGHPDLQVTPDGSRKIVTWQDFTDEGIIDTKAIASKSGGSINLVDGNYSAETIVSKSGAYHYGFIREKDFSNGSGEGLDLNFNGSLTDVFAVIVVDELSGGKYDAVYVDTDMDKDFTDEKPLKLFETNQSFSGFASADGKNLFNFSIIELKADGKSIRLGFDGNDHGTHVAGIAAANGRAQGVAPGAQLMALKVLDSEGYGSWTNVSRAMVYAATNGAQIINLSLGFKPEDYVGGSVPAKMINSLTREYGVIIVTAAGNDGPGLNSLATPADADMALSVGAFTSPEMWMTDYGWNVPADNLWFFSAVGPRGDGAMAPRVVAPGSAVSTVPMRKGESYFLSEGTSMAAPHVSGSLALLMEAADKSKLSVDVQHLKKSIEMGTKRIDNYSYAEQGYGMVNLVQAWRELQFIKDQPNYFSSVYNSNVGMGTGIFEDQYIPGELSWYLRNDSGNSKELAIYSHSDWVTENVDTLLIPAGQTREIPLRFNVPNEPGVYSGVVRADDQRTYGIDVDLPVVAIRPHLLDSTNNWSQQIDDTLKPAQYKRYFFKVEPQAAAINVKLESAMSGDKFAGKVRMYLYAPDGTKKAETLFAGGDSTGQASVEATEQNPQAGTWQVVVYSSASLSDLGLYDSRFSLDVSLSNVSSNSLPVQDRKVIISMVPRQMPEGRDSYVTLQVRTRDDKKPFQGAIEINGKLYYTRKGYVTIPVKAAAGIRELEVRTVTDISKYRPLEYTFHW